MRQPELVRTAQRSRDEVLSGLYHRTQTCQSWILRLLNAPRPLRILAYNLGSTHIDTNRDTNLGELWRTMTTRRRYNWRIIRALWMPANPGDLEAATLKSAAHPVMPASDVDIRFATDSRSVGQRNNRPDD